MLDILCEDCGNLMVLDELSTFEGYKKDGKLKLNEFGELDEECIPKHIVFRCLKCDSICNLSYEEWFNKVKYKIAKDVMYATRQELFKKPIQH